MMQVKLNKRYIPEQGDIIWMDLNPTNGHEQSGYRPVLILSKASINSRSCLAILCPITSKNKNYPFHVCLRDHETKGYIMSDQVKTMDWRNRKIKFVEKIDEETYQEVVARISALISN